MECHLCGKNVEDIKIYVEHVLYECASSTSMNQEQDIPSSPYMDQQASPYQ